MPAPSNHVVVLNGNFCLQLFVLKNLAMRKKPLYVIFLHHKFSQTKLF